MLQYAFSHRLAIVLDRQGMRTYARRAKRRRRRQARAAKFHEAAESYVMCTRRFGCKLLCACSERSRWSVTLPYTVIVETISRT